jgi:hypothetical protein
VFTIPLPICVPDLGKYDQCSSMPGFQYCVLSTPSPVNFGICVQSSCTEEDLFKGPWKTFIELHIPATVSLGFPEHFYVACGANAQPWTTGVLLP